MEDEIVIKIDSFSMKQLEKLHIVLENNNIINIKNEFGRIIINFQDKKIELNEEYNLKIKLLRNRYYRQLLNYIYQYKDLTITKFDELGNVVNKDLKKCIDITKYKEGLKMALINYIGLYNFDNIFELTKEEMLEIEDLKYDPNNNTKNIYEAYGMYCHKTKSLIELLKIDEERLSEIEKCNKFIIICPEFIREYCLEHFEEYKDDEILDEFQLFNIIYNKVLIHEIGHAVFDYINDDENEKRANFYVSITFDGTFDNIIEKFTEHQDERYKNPILITKDDMKKIKKEIYHI